VPKLKIRSKTTAEEFENGAKEIAVRKREKVDPDHLLPTGSTLLNLACSDNPFGGYQIGKVANLIGDSASGKSMLALTTLAEMCINKKFDDYLLIYDDVEAALEFDINYLFGPLYDKINLDYISNTAQDFFENIMRVIKLKTPFIYVLDSFDALTSKEEIERAQKRISKSEKERKKADASFKTEKPRLASEMLRVIKRDVKNQEALVLIVSQTRDNLGFGAQFQPKIRSGGKALKFYSCHEIWLAMVGQIPSHKRVIGNRVEAKVTKNKTTGKRRDAHFSVFDDYGVDDITALVDFLINEGHWKKKDKTIIADDFKIEGMVSTIVHKIEQMGAVHELKTIVGDVWATIEEKIRLDRVPRF